MNANLAWEVEPWQRHVVRVENRQYIMRDNPRQAECRIALSYICIVPRRLRTLLQAGCLLVALILLASFAIACRILTQPDAECVRTMLEFSPNRGVFQIFVPTNDRTFLEKFKIKKNMNTNSVFINFEVENMAQNSNEYNLMDYLTYRKLTVDDLGKDIFYTYYFLSALEFSFVPPLLQLTNNVRADQNITVRTIAISRHSSICFNNLIHEHDAIMKSNVKEMAAQLVNNNMSSIAKNSKGFIRDLRTGRVSEITESPSFLYRFFSSIIFFYIFVSAVCAFFNYVQLEYNGIRLFYHNLMDRAIARPAFPASKVLTLLMAMIGMDSILMRFLENRLVMFFVFWSIFEAENVNSRSFQSPTSRKHWYKFYFLYLWFFLALELHYTQFTNMSFSIYIFFNLYTYLFFFNNYEIPHIVASNQIFALQYELFKRTHEVQHLPIYSAPPERRQNQSRHRNLHEHLRQMHYSQNAVNTIWRWRIVIYMLQIAIVMCEYLDSLLPDDFLQDQPEDTEVRRLRRIESHQFGVYSYIRLLVRFAFIGPERPFSERQASYGVQTERIFVNDENDNESDEDYNDEGYRPIELNVADNRIFRNIGHSETSSTRTDDDDDAGSAFDEVNLDVDDL